MQDDGLNVNEPAKRPRLETPSILGLIPLVCAYHPSPVNVTHRVLATFHTSSRRQISAR